MLILNKDVELQPVLDFPINVCFKPKKCIQFYFMLQTE